MRRVLLFVLVLLVLAGGLMLWGGEPSRSIEDARASVTRVQPSAAAQERAPSGSEAEPAGEVKRAVKSRSERDALRRRIVEALESRERDAAAGRAVEAAGGEEGARAARKKKAAAAEGEAPTPGGLVDRTGNHGYLMKVMNEELMPLVDECYALARQAKPELAGELRLSVELLGDEELGGVVESVEPGEGNELADPGLIECARESILSTTLPPPPQGGRDAFALFLKLTPEEAGAGQGAQEP